MIKKQLLNDENVTFDDVLNIIYDECYKKVCNIIVTTEGDFYKMARQLYANGFGNLEFYPWSVEDFDPDDPSTYCTGIDFDATFHFNPDRIDGIKMDGTLSLTVQALEGGIPYNIEFICGDFSQPKGSDISFTELKKKYKRNPELFKVTDYFKIERVSEQILLGR